LARVSKVTLAFGMPFRASALAEIPAAKIFEKSIETPGTDCGGLRFIFAEAATPPRLEAGESQPAVSAPLSR
jgi:hypothetical protein